VGKGPSIGPKNLNLVVAVWMQIFCFITNLNILHLRSCGSRYLQDQFLYCSRVIRVIETIAVVAEFFLPDGGNGISVNGLNMCSSVVGLICV